MNKELNNVKILDCTLRDGGYYTNWWFSDKFVENYLSTISKLPIDIVELGYLSNNIDEFGIYYHLNKASLSKAKSILRKNQKIYAMLNLKEFKSVSEMKSLIKKNSSFLDGIRFAVSPYELKNYKKFIDAACLNFKKIDINVNIMYFSKWHDNKNIIENINNNINSKIKTLALVDSYGALQPNHILNSKNFINKLNFKLGAHFHNNCGLAIANSLAAIDNNCTVVDSTFTGMGRGAGNAATEILIAILKKVDSKISGFKINELLSDFLDLKSKLRWGESYAYAYAAKNGFSQSKIMDLIQKRRLNSNTAIKILNVKESKKLEISNISRLKNKKKILKNHPLFIGAGSSIFDYGKTFFENLSSKTPLFFTGSNSLNNFLKLNIKIKNSIFLILTGDEISKFENKNINKFFKDAKIDTIIIEKSFKPNFLKFKNVVECNTLAINAILLGGLVLKKIGIKNLNIAFFDGVNENSASVKSIKVMEETEECIKELLANKLNINTLTKTYLKVPFKKIWAN